MYDKNEELTCSSCGNIFEGRKPPEDISIICPSCVDDVELAIINDGDDIPEEVHKEIEGGGEDGGNKKKK